MGKVLITGSGSAGAGSDECTTTRSEVLKGYTAITSDSDDEVVEGTLELIGDAADSQVLAGKTYYNTNPKIKRTGIMVNHGAVSQALDAGGSYTVPSGYHNGSGKVTANSLSSQTSGTSTAAQILSPYTAWVNGSKLTGSIVSLAGQTIIPSASQQTVSSSGKYMTGNVVVNAVSNLSAGNIKKGVNVGGTTGTFEGYVPTATDLYLRGSNIVGLTVNSNYESLDSGQITVKDDVNHTSITSMSTNLTGYTRLNIQGYKNNAAAGEAYLLYNGSQVGQVLSIPTGNYTIYFNVTNIQVSASFQVRLVIMKGSIYRIWKS